MHSCNNNRTEWCLYRKYNYINYISENNKCITISIGYKNGKNWLQTREMEKICILCINQENVWDKKCTLLIWEYDKKYCKFFQGNDEAGWALEKFLVPIYAPRSAIFWGHTLFFHRHVLFLKHAPFLETGPWFDALSDPLLALTVKVTI